MKVTITYSKVIKKTVEVPEEFRIIRPDTYHLTSKEEQLLNKLVALCENIAAKDDGELLTVMDEAEERWYAEM